LVEVPRTRHTRVTGRVERRTAIHGVSSAFQTDHIQEVACSARGTFVRISREGGAVLGSVGLAHPSIKVVALFACDTLIFVEVVVPAVEDGVRNTVARI
jgi:hypothetical protein